MKPYIHKRLRRARLQKEVEKEWKKKSWMEKRRGWEYEDREERYIVKKRVEFEEFQQR